MEKISQEVSTPHESADAVVAESSLRCYLPRRLALLYTFMRRRPREVMEHATTSGYAMQVAFLISGQRL